MKYVRGSTLLPLKSRDIRTLPRVPWRQLPTRDLLLYDEGVSNFFFEFEPEEEIDRFLQHAHFGCHAHGGLLACREDLQQIALNIRPGAEPPPELVIPLTSADLPAPLRFVRHQPAFDSLEREGHWR